MAQTRFEPPGNPALAGEVAALHGLADELRRPLDGTEPAARAYQAERLNDARAARRGNQAHRARRLSRKAEKAQREASLALARAF